jgi:RNA polymerase sigma factor (sigma-70 family)
MLVHGPDRLPPRQQAGDRRTTPAADRKSKISMRRRAEPPSDDALVQRTRAGDEASFETIFKRHHRALLSYCRHMLGDRDEAEDALQHAFIRAHKALARDAPPRELRPWLYAIARNCCLSAIAARRPTTEIEEGRAPSLVGLSDQVQAREALRELVADIARLPEDQRSALLLSELDDLSHAAIATVIGCPVSKVKALVYQARTGLIAERDARSESCRDIREQLSVARGGELRRGPLRRHLSMCSGCRDFQHLVAAQRQSLAAVLPVLPSAALAARVLGHGGGTASIGTTGAGLAPAGGAAATGTSVAASAGTGLAVVETTGATAVAGAVSSTSASAMIGGGLFTKFAVAGTVAALASVGAVAIPRRLPHGGRHTGRVGAHRVVRPPTALAAAAALVGAPGPVASPVGLATAASANGSAPGQGTGSGGVVAAAVLGALPATVSPNAQVVWIQPHRPGSAGPPQPTTKLTPSEHFHRRSPPGATRHRPHRFHHRHRHKLRKPIRRHRRLALVSTRGHRQAMMRPAVGSRPPNVWAAPSRPRRARSAPSARWKAEAMAWAPSSRTATETPTAKRPIRERPPAFSDAHPASYSGLASRSACEHSSGHARCRDGASGGSPGSTSGGSGNPGSGYSSTGNGGGEAAHAGSAGEGSAARTAGAESGDGVSRAGDGTVTPRGTVAPLTSRVDSETAAGRLGESPRLDRNSTTIQPRSEGDGLRRGCALKQTGGMCHASS